MSFPDSPLPTLPFGQWLRALQASERANAGMAVECGDCRGCCTSAYFIPVGPEETAALARIPKRLLFPAPGRPKGHFLLGYDERGHCALFKDDACSIYADRPRACRAYDCRVFAATGLSETEKPAIARQAGRWRFALPAEEDERLLAAVRAAARFLREHAGEFPAGFLPPNATQQAMVALRIHGLFLRPQGRVPEMISEAIKAARRPPEGELRGPRGPKAPQTAPKTARTRRSPRSGRSVRGTG